MTAPLTNPARSSLRGIACPASSHIGRAGTNHQRKDRYIANFGFRTSALIPASRGCRAALGIQSATCEQADCSEASIRARASLPAFQGPSALAEPRQRRVMRALPVGTGAASVAPIFPPFGLRLSGAILSAASNRNARRGSGRAGNLHHDLRETCATARDNRAALKPFGILPDRAANDGRAYFPVLLAGHCPRRTAHTTALCFSLQTSAASVAAFAGGC